MDYALIIGIIAQKIKNFINIGQLIKNQSFVLFHRGQYSIVPPFHHSIRGVGPTGRRPIVTCPLMLQAVSPCPSAIGCASGECRAGLAGWHACNGMRGEALSRSNGFKRILPAGWGA